MTKAEMQERIEELEHCAELLEWTNAYLRAKQSAEAEQYEARIQELESQVTLAWAYSNEFEEEARTLELQLEERNDAQEQLDEALTRIEELEDEEYHLESKVANQEIQIERLEEERDEALDERQLLEIKIQELTDYITEVEFELAVVQEGMEVSV